MSGSTIRSQLIAAVAAVLVSVTMIGATIAPESAPYNPDQEIVIDA